MSEFPDNINDSLPQLAPLYRVYQSSKTPEENGMDTGGEVAKVSDPTAALGENPSVKDLANLLLTDLGGRIDQIKHSQGVLASGIAQNTKDVELHGRQIEWLRGQCRASDEKQQAVQSQLEEVKKALAAVEEEKAKQYRLTCEIRQRGVKGNFILSGPHVPRYARGENLYDIVCRIVWDKYGVELDWWQMKALHRLPNNGIILAMNTRMPGAASERLMAAVNSNPNPQVKAYLNIQLMEPFNSLHYACLLYTSPSPRDS